MTSYKLSKAIAQGNIEDVLELLSEWDVNQSMGARGTPLCAAILGRQLKVVELLVTRKCDVNLAHHSGESPLSLAICNELVGIAILLIHSGADVNHKDVVNKSPPLCLAVNSGLFDVVHCLLKAKADTQGRETADNTALHIATQKGDLKMMRLLLSFGSPTNLANVAGNHPLHIAACQGDLGAIWLLVGVDPTGTKEPPSSLEIERCFQMGEENLRLIPEGRNASTLSSACVGSDMEPLETTCNMLVEGGEEAIHRCEINEGRALSGDTALHLAVVADKPLAVKLLLHAGADVNVVNNQERTPLFEACARSNMKMVRILLKAGANPNSVASRQQFLHNYLLNKTAVLPLTVAAENNNTELINLLVEYGALFSVPVDSENGFTRVSNPLFVALYRNKTDAAHCLLDHADDFSSSFDINAQINEGTSYLFAVVNCEQEMIPLAKKLIQLGCNVHTNALDDFGNSTIQNAVVFDSPELVQLLLDNGADPDDVNMDGENALITSIREDNSACFRVLLQHGMDLRLTWKPYPSCEPVSLIELSLDEDHDTRDMVDLLIESGADLNMEKYLFDPDSKMLDLVREEDEDLANRLLAVAHNAPSLVCCSVRRIRSHFREKKIPFPHVYHLPIPRTLGDKITGKDSCFRR